MTRRASNGSEVTVRRAVASDVDAVSALVTSEAPTSYVHGARYFAQRAFAGSDDDTLCLLAGRAGAIVGCVLYGMVAGALGTARINFIAVVAAERRQGVGSLLCASACEALFSRGARRVIVELPDDSTLHAARGLLATGGFAEIARVAGYVRDDVDLVIMERRSA